MSRVSLWFSFSRAQVASLVATVVDFSVLWMSVEILHIWYVPAVSLGAFCGAVVHFLLSRQWCFLAFSQSIWKQWMRYALVSGGSLGINTLGVYLVTEFGGVQYLVSKVIVSFLVGVFFNFPLHRFYVFSTS